METLIAVLAVPVAGLLGSWLTNAYNLRTRERERAEKLDDEYREAARKLVKVSGQILRAANELVDSAKLPPKGEYDFNSERNIEYHAAELTNLESELFEASASVLVVESDEKLAYSVEAFEDTVSDLLADVQTNFHNESGMRQLIPGGGRLRMLVQSRRELVRNVAQARARTPWHKRRQKDVTTPSDEMSPPPGYRRNLATKSQ